MSRIDFFKTPDNPQFIKEALTVEVNIDPLEPGSATLIANDELQGGLPEGYLNRPDNIGNPKKWKNRAAYLFGSIAITAFITNLITSTDDNSKDSVLAPIETISPITETSSSVSIIEFSPLTTTTSTIAVLDSTTAVVEQLTAVTVPLEATVLDTQPALPTEETPITVLSTELIPLEEVSPVSTTTTEVVRIVDKNCEKFGEEKVIEVGFNLYDYLINIGFTPGQTVYLINKTTFVQDFGIRSIAGNSETLPTTDDILSVMYCYRRD